MKPTVFIQANDRQMLGARISAYSYRRASRSPDRFEVRIMSVRDFPRLARPGQSILRGGHIRDWDPDDLQSFSPLRFAPPTLMGFEGRAAGARSSRFCQRSCSIRVRSRRTVALSAGDVIDSLGVVEPNWKQVPKGAYP